MQREEINENPKNVLSVGIGALFERVLHKRPAATVAATEQLGGGLNRAE